MCCCRDWLQEEITRLTRAEEESSSENSRLSKQLEESENLCLSLKELLESSGQADLCGSLLLSGSGQNRTDLQKAAEEDQGSTGRVQRDDRGTQTEKAEEAREEETQSPSRSVPESDVKWTQTERKGEKKPRSRSREKERAELQSLALKVEALQEQLKKLEAENQELAEKACSKNTTDSSSDEDDALQPSIKHKPQQKVKTLERQLQVLHSENLRLADKLVGSPPSNRHDPDEIIERIVELEDFCTELQDRVREAEGHERQMREKLRLAEQTINELESSEAQYRDRCDELSQLERETKKQLHNLQATGRELREIILDKDIVEQALTEKVLRLASLQLWLMLPALTELL